MHCRRAAIIAKRNAPVHDPNAVIDMSADDTAATVEDDGFALDEAASGDGAATDSTEAAAAAITSPPVAEQDVEASMAFIAYARVFSGVLRPGMKVGKAELSWYLPSYLINIKLAAIHITFCCYRSRCLAPSMTLCNRESTAVKLP